MSEFHKIGVFRSCLYELRSNYLFDRAYRAAENGNRQKADAFFKESAKLVTQVAIKDIMIDSKGIMRGKTMPAWAHHFTYWNQQPKKHRGFTIPKRPPDFGTYILKPAWFAERFVIPEFNRQVSRLERHFRKAGYSLIAIADVKDTGFDDKYPMVRAWLTPLKQSRTSRTAQPG